MMPIFAICYCPRLTQDRKIGTGSIADITQVADSQSVRRFFVVSTLTPDGQFDQMGVRLA
jgi:hypothetical protein